jgi:hypothetical protein
MQISIVASKNWSFMPRIVADRRGGPEIGPR